MHRGGAASLGTHQILHTGGSCPGSLRLRSGVDGLLLLGDGLVFAQLPHGLLALHLTLEVPVLNHPQDDGARINTAAAMTRVRIR